jgi:hypothetical protein
MLTDRSYKSMAEHLRKAVEAREDIFQADREAIADLPNSFNSTELEKTVAKQKARGMAQVKELVANNRWYMMQAITFGVASIARAAWGIHGEVVQIRQMMEAMRDEKASS